jgi:hypothetical protein
MIFAFDETSIGAGVQVFLFADPRPPGPDPCIRLTSGALQNRNQR